MRTRSTPRGVEVFFIALFGLAFYCSLFGVDTLVPTQVAWMLQGDPAQHYLGWQFFRVEPWHWPPGRIAHFGYPLGAAIGLTDSIPLLALALKPVSALLPAEFQYFGLWMASCFVLNGYFGLRLMSRLTSHTALRCVGAAFFVLSPPLLLRGYGHEALMAHWLLLASIERYQVGWSWRHWLAIGTFASLCHPYILLMVLGIMAAAVIAALMTDSKLRLIVVAMQIVGIALAIGTCLWLAGYFSGGGGLAGEGYGYFSMNILSLVDPLLGWSRFLRQRPIHPDYQNLGNFGQYEGFLYLGAGMLLLIPAAITGYLAQPAPRRALVIRSWWPLVCVAVIFWVMALSNVIMLADQRLFTVPLPDGLHKLLSIFRASGRLGWPSFYLISLAVLAAIVRYLSPRSALVVLFAGLILQWADQSEKYLEFREIIRQRATWQSPLQSPHWNDWASRSTQLVLVPPLPNSDKAYIPFAHLASRYGLSTNAANIARAAAGHINFGASEAVLLASGRNRPNVLYVFLQPPSTDALPQALRDQMRTVDGFQVLPPSPVGVNPPP